MPTLSIKRKLEVFAQLNRSARTTSAPVYKTPKLSMLKDYDNGVTHSTLDPHVLESKLREFGFEGTVVNIRRGPVITRYEIKLASGVRISQIKNVTDDIAIALMSEKIRILAPIPGTALIGIEVANDKASTIGLKTILQSYTGAERIPIALGTDTTGTPKIVDLARMPHLLIAGQTGSGKSVCMNSIILSILFTRTPEECQLVLVDPKRVEMAAYRNVPHLKYPVVTDPNRATEIFSKLITEMEHRYETLEQNGVRNIESYNDQAHTKMPYIVAMVDEMADLKITSGKELEMMISRLAQLARAVGIHLVLATQKPEVKVITGLIKSNMPSRISFQVASKNDSRVILDCNGAEKLIGRGDMLMLYPGAAEPERFHGAWVSDNEIQTIVGRG
jgi:S-DNA-T family DNA segregation ATPase FtsK/SpoIIIE